MEVSEISSESEVNLKTPLSVAWDRGGSFRAESKGPSGVVIVCGGNRVLSYIAPHA